MTTADGALILLSWRSGILNAPQKSEVEETHLSGQAQDSNVDGGSLKTMIQELYFAGGCTVSSSQIFWP
jgi:hypothetical protein